jgi:hypothetical protein
MNPNTKLATMFIVVVVLGTIGTTATTAFAKETPPGIALEADDKVHDIDDVGSQQDVRFHEGLCQAGITTDALGEQGCDNPVLTPAPGASDEVRRD